MLPTESAVLSKNIECHAFYRKCCGSTVLDRSIYRTLYDAAKKIEQMIHFL